MRTLILSLLLILACSSLGWAKVAISPVIIEATSVKAGDRFEILCEQWGEEPLLMTLSLAGFDQDLKGAVHFLEDDLARQRAEELLRLDQVSVILEPQGQHRIQVTLEKDDFQSAYLALFIKLERGGIPTRMAVLFLLSTSDQWPELNLLAWERKAEGLSFLIANDGLRHGLWRGELLCYNAADELEEKLQVESGVVLAGRSRGFVIGLPDWVERVEVVPTGINMPR